MGNMLKRLFEKIERMLTVNKYYKMTDRELEIEAHKWNIGMYGNPNTGLIDRQIIIDALLKKDKANDSRLAIFISIISLLISIIALLKK
jgi:hypothetical protein